jgi:hypothetical protein
MRRSVLSARNCGDLIEAVAPLDDDTGGAQNPHVLRGQVGGLTNAFGYLDDHELVAVGQLAQDAPANGTAEDFNDFIEGDGGRGRWRWRLEV